MAEKKRKNHRPGQKSVEQRSTESIQRLPFLGGKYDVAAFDRFVSAYQMYEDWLASRREHPLVPVAVLDQLPGYGDPFLLAAPGAFSFLRHSLRRYLWTIPHEPGYAAALQSLLRRAEASDATGFEDFRRVLRAADERFLRQWRNTRAEHDRARNNEGRDRLEFLVRWFINFFETDAYLWFLGVLAKSISTGRVDATLFGGPETTAAQGALVRQIVEALGTNPLSHVVRRAYDAPLRNAIGHNDYEWVTEADGSHALVDHAGDRRFTEEELYAQLAEAQALEQALLSAVLGLFDEPRRDDLARLSDQGVIATLLISGVGGGLGLVLFQLWCFADLDSQGTWLDSGGVGLMLEPCDSCDERRHTYLRLTPNSLSPLPSDDVEAFQRAVGSEEWVHVWRLRVAPFIGAPGLRVTLPCGEFVVLGTPDRQLLQYTGVEQAPLHR